MWFRGPIQPLPPFPDPDRRRRESLAALRRYETEALQDATRAKAHGYEGPQQAKQEAGWKYDAGKARIDLIAPEFITGTADILAFGAEKYGERNWEAGMSWSRPFAALMRHMWAWWAGEKADPETGKSHLWHASCCLMFLVAFEARAVGNDDRAKKFDDLS